MSERNYHGFCAEYPASYGLRVSEELATTSIRDEITRSAYDT
jgi:hypothetical protein